jgi:hypothetical protein
MLVLAELTPLDPVTGLRVTLRVCSSEDRAITALNGVRWWPALVETPVLTMRLFDGDFSSDVEVGGPSMAVLHNRLLKLDANAGRFLWAGAGVKIWAGNSGAAWPWTQWFEGVVTGFEGKGYRLKLQMKVNTEPFEKDVLTSRYAGTGGAEGDANIKNKVKPWIFGRATDVEPVLINAVDNVYQFSAYGPIQAVTALFERGSDFGAAVGDYASYAALVAATIPAGRWGTCLAQGMVRLGAPAYGVITGDIDGDKPSGTWIRNAGVSGTLIDSASLAALDAAVTAATPGGGNINLVLDEQTTVLDVARRLARPCNAQAGLSWLGKLFLTRPAIGTPALVLDAQGRRKPGVIRAVETDVSPPYWRIEMGAQQAWRLHSFDEISTYDEIIDRGSYVSTGWYRAGNIVKDQNMRWRYVNATPGTGNAPPTRPTSSNAWWEALDPALAGVADGATSDVNLSAVVSANAGSIRIRGNSVEQVGANSSYSYAVKGQALTGACVVEYDISSPSWNIVALDDDATTTDYSTQSATGFYDKSTGNCYLFYGSVQQKTANIGTSVTGKIALAFDKVKVRLLIGGVERLSEIAPAGLTGTIVPKWYPYNTGTLYTGLRADYFTDNDFASAQIAGQSEILIYADYSGAPKTGELTKTLAYKLFRSGVQLTSGVTWSRTLLSGSATTAISGTGTATLDVTGPASAALSTESVVRIVAIYEGVSAPPMDVTIRRRDDPPPTGGTGGSGNPGTTASTSTINSTSSTSYGASAIAVLTVVAGTAGQVALTAPLSARRSSNSDGSTATAGKWRWSVVGGVKADVGAETGSTSDAVTITNPGDPTQKTNGSLSVSITKTGLTPGTSYEFDFLVRKGAETGAASTITFTGTCTATGS